MDTWRRWKISSPVSEFIQGVGGNWKGVQSPITAAKYLGTRLLQATLSETLYRGFGEPDVLFVKPPLFYIPLYNVQWFEIGRSQDLLQFRSLGAEFLAQQKGGHWGVRIDCLLIGPLKELFLSYLQFLHLNGRKRIEQVIPEEQVGEPNTTEITYRKVLGTQTKNIGGTPQNTIVTNPASLPSSLTNVFNIGKTYAGSPETQNRPYTKLNQEYKYDTISQQNEFDVMKETSEDPNKKIVGQRDYNWSNVEYHNTFTLTTENEMLFDMYIETIRHAKRIDKGSEVIEVNILLRHFVPPERPKKLTTVITARRGGDYGRINKLNQVISSNNVKKTRVLQTTSRFKTAKGAIAKKLVRSPWIVDYGLNVLHRTLSTVFRTRSWNWKNSYEFNKYNIETGTGVLPSIAGKLIGKGKIDLGVF